MKEIAVLAFSGGLDTTYCAMHLSKDLGLEVHSVLVNTGGFGKEELADIEKKAYELGVTRHTAIDATHDFYDRCVRYLIFGNVLKNNTYPLSVSAERAFQAMAIADYAAKVNAKYIAHGSTGAGNDQVRFDMVFGIICPQAQIITPIRDHKLSREEEIEYLKKHGVQRNWEKSRYSINKGIWGTSVGGKETLTSDQYLPEEAFPTQVTKSGTETLEITFEKGEPKGVNGKTYTHPVEAIQAIQQIAAPYGVGRDIHVGDTIIGIKGRVGFEAAAPMIVIKAHHALEKHVLTKWQLQLKDTLSPWYGNLLHEGHFLEPAMRNIEAFLQDSQQHVSGTVKVHLAPYHFHIIGIQSSHDLMANSFASYGEMNNGWSGEDVKGFAKVASIQGMIYSHVNGQTESVS
ncbi:MAG: argininosuccinate synthase [Flavobacteriales bacterium]|nr:argininosuccinate synthase [Flavobacteriales bacterium]MCB9449490.1 argininosuccinate synthase [Flavobacteriales bacterium]